MSGSLVKKKMRAPRTLEFNREGRGAVWNDIYHTRNQPIDRFSAYITRCISLVVNLRSAGAAKRALVTVAF